MWARHLVAAGLTLVVAASQAEEPAYKFTTGVYSSSGGGQPNAQGLDLNLRRTSDAGNAWLAWYRSPTQDIRQPRMGWDNSLDVSQWRIQPSLQMASGGFVGGSVFAETGTHWVGGAGLGRTNLHPYVNLNFDPNDAWMASGGYRWNTQHSLLLQVVRDNRANPDQQHVHLVYHTPQANDQRLTLDVLFKSGTVEDQYIRKTGYSVTYDWPGYFVRLAYDPYVNFTSQNMWRMAVGSRF